MAKWNALPKHAELVDIDGKTKLTL